MRTAISAALALGLGYLVASLHDGFSGQSGPFGEHLALTVTLFLVGGAVVGLVAGSSWWLAGLAAWPLLLPLVSSLAGSLLGGPAGDPTLFLQLFGGVALCLVGGLIGRRQGARLGFE